MDGILLLLVLLLIMMVTLMKVIHLNGLKMASRRLQMLRGSQVRKKTRLTPHWNRVSKCRRYGRYICVKFLVVWGKILESNICTFDVG